MNNSVYFGVEFDISAGGGVALVNSNWLTPRKREVYWPPYKQQSQYTKSLKKGEVPVENEWKIYSISRCFFETDDYETACKKLKLCEVTSDIPSDLEQDTSSSKSKRIVRRPRKILDSSESDSEDDQPLKKIARPPRIIEQVVSPPRTPSTVVVQTLTPSQSTIQNSTPSQSITQNSTPSTSFRYSPLSIDEFDIRGGFRDTFLKILIEIREQNKQILAHLFKKPEVSNLILKQVPADIPVQLPLVELNDLNSLELYLEEKRNTSALSLYLSTLGGRDLANSTNKVLKHILSNSLASEYSFYGKRSQKRPFCDLKLKTVVVDAVKVNYDKATEKDIEDAIKIWLKHSPQRLKAEQIHK